jgi:hypothetical protein
MPAGVLRSQSGRTSLVTARRSCQRSATHGLFARISWQIQEGVNLGHADSLWAFSNFIFVHWAGFRVAKFQEAQSRGSGEDREFHGSKRDLAGRKTSRGTYNFRYSAMKPETATTCKPLKRLAGPTGFEPATSCVTGRRSNQTELRPRMRINDIAKSLCLWAYCRFRIYRTGCSGCTRWRPLPAKSAHKPPIKPT